MKAIWAGLGCLLACCVFAQQAAAVHPQLPENKDFSDTLSALIEPEDADIDLTWSKLVIDNLVDPSVDITATDARMDAIASEINGFLGDRHDPATTVEIMRTFVYIAGDWNDGQPFGYDFDNPNGRLAENKTLDQYLDTRKGNCVNMPIFFVVLGEKLGVDMNLTTAPLHVFIQFDNPSTGKVEHLEATSGAQPQRLVWQRQVFNMTDRSLESGMYMKRLSKREMVALMGETLLQRLVETGDLDDRIEVAQIIHDTFPEADVPLMHLASALHQKIIRDFQSKYPMIENIPPELLPELDELARRRDEASLMLDQLGWQPYKPTEHVVLPD